MQDDNQNRSTISHPGLSGFKFIEGVHNDNFAKSRA